MLTAAHEPLIRAAALNHISPYFADVVWDGLSTTHVREGLDGQRRRSTAAAHVAADQPVAVPGSHPRPRDPARLRAVRPHVPRRSVAKLLVNEFRRRSIPHQLLVLPCGHYSTGVTPFKWMDGITLCRFLNRAL